MISFRTAQTLWEPTVLPAETVAQVNARAKREAVAEEVRQLTALYQSCPDQREEIAEELDFLRILARSLT